MSATDGRITSLDLEDLEPVELPFTQRGVQYVLREPTADAAKKWKAAVIRAHRPGPDGKLVPTDALPDTSILLLSLCVYEADGGRVPMKDGLPDPKRLAAVPVILSFGSKAVESLFRACKEIGGLSEEDDEATPGLLREKIAGLQKKLEEMERDRGNG